MIKGFLNIPYFAWSALALILSLVWFNVGTHRGMAPTPGFRNFIIHWGHALTWLFLALSFFLRGIGPDLNGGSTFFGFAGGVMYILFILMTFVVK